MFASSMVAYILSAAVVLASDYQARSHHAAIAKRLDSDTSLGRRDTYSGKEMTWYPTTTGPDACTGKNHQDSDFFVAMGTDQFGGGPGCCGRKLRINYKGKSAVATCVDECTSCPQWGQIDLTKGLFKYLTGGDLDVGVIFGSWSYVDGNDNGGDNGNDGDSAPAKKTTAHRTTSTHKATSTNKKEVAPTSTHRSLEHSPTSSAKSSAQPSPSAKPSSSDPEPSSSPEDGSPLPSATSGVQNVGSGTSGDSSSDSDSGSGADGVSGALTGSSSGTASFGTNNLAVAVAALALAVVQAL